MIGIDENMLQSRKTGHILYTLQSGYGLVLQRLFTFLHTLDKSHFRGIFFDEHTLGTVNIIKYMRKLQ